MIINGREYNVAEAEANFKECEIVYEDQYMTTNPKVQMDNAKNFLFSNAEMILYLANGKLFLCDSYSKLEMATDIAVQKYPLTWAWAIDSTGLLSMSSPISSKLGSTIFLLLVLVLHH